MTLQSLEYFVAIAKKRNITAVAEELYVSQPAISRQIQMLETELGVKLFQRTKPNLTLTEDGRYLLEKAERIVRQIEDLRTSSARMSQGHYGTVKIGFVGAPEFEALMRFASAAAIYFPNCSFEFEQGNMSDLHRKLKEGTYDLVFTPLTGLLEDPELDTFLIGEPFAALAVSEFHPLASRDLISFSELKDENFVIIARHGSPAHSDRLIQECNAAGFSPKHIYEVTSTPAQVLMVAANQAVALVSKNIQEFYNIGIKFINISDLQEAYVKVGVAWRKNHLSPLAKTMLNTIC